MNINIISTYGNSLAKLTKALAFCALPLSLVTLSSVAEQSLTNTETVLTEATQGAFFTNEYRNVFIELDIATADQVDRKVHDTYQQLFYSDSRGENGEAVFFPVGNDMGFIKDIGDNDIRSEGMSYGMMIAVQMGDQGMFNKLWKFSKTYMQHSDGWYKNYFAWHLNPDAPYSHLSENPAPDGELYFAMALLFAENRWGAGTGIYQYKAEANTILQAMTNKTETDSQVTMFSREEKQILFVTEKSLGIYTDPSYHVAAFYELFARWADEDNQLWADAAQVTRDYLYNASHPSTGLYSEYAAFDGTPQVTSFNDISHKSGYDAFRVIGNIAMDYHWFNADSRQEVLAQRLITFYASEYKQKGQNYAVHEMEGENVSEWDSAGQNAMNGTAAMITTSQDSKDFTQRLWNQSTPTGKWRYYDGLLHMFAMLQMSGKYRIYSPPATGNLPARCD